jgi:hypothetical protein
VDIYFSNIQNTIENISPLRFLTLDIFTIFGFFTLANYLLIFYWLGFLMDNDLVKLVQLS